MHIRLLIRHAGPTRSRLPAGHSHPLTKVLPLGPGRVQNDLFRAVLSAILANFLLYRKHATAHPIDETRRGGRNAFTMYSREEWRRPPSRLIVLPGPPNPREPYPERARAVASSGMA
jgi:hypothetical protein